MLNKSFIIVLILLAQLLRLSFASAGSITVDTLNDVTGNVDDLCSLREAISMVNNFGAAGGDCVAVGSITKGGDNEIIFGIEGTINLVLGELVIDNNVIINPTHKKITIARTGEGLFAGRVIQVINFVDEPVIVLNSLELTGGNGFSDGSAVYNFGGAITLNRVIVSGNFVRSGDGGAIYNQLGTMNIVDSTIFDNMAKPDDRDRDGRGGGVYVKRGVVTITRSKIYQNTSSSGGGIYTEGGKLIISNSEIFDNFSNLGGGREDQEGGGILAVNTEVIINKSTISNNRAVSVGGIGMVNSELTMLNSTLSGNRAEDFVGGLAALDSTISLRNSTIAFNRSREQIGSGVFSSSSSMRLRNTIISNSSGVDCFLSSGSTIDANVYNVISDGSCSSSSLVGDPGLLPLANNGGFTKTHALATSSLAKNSGLSTSECLATDQRGKPRSDGLCDIGSFEAQEELDEKYFLGGVLLLLLDE